MPEAIAAKQFNFDSRRANNPNALPYKTTRIYSAFRSNTPSEARVGSYIADHSGEIRPCKHSKQYIADKLGLSKVTVFRSLKKLDEAELIERHERALFAHIPKDKYTKYPSFLSEHVFFFELEEHGKTIRHKRRLLKSELDIYGEIYTWTESRLNTKSFYLTSLSMLSNITGYSVRTVQRALKVLLKCGLIRRTRDNIGTSSAHMSAYSLNKHILKRISRQSEDTASNNPPTRAEIERYYSELRNAAENEAETNEKECLKDPEYKQLHGKVKALEYKKAMAEAAAEDPNATDKERHVVLELDDEYRKAVKRRRVRLEELGFLEEDLKPRYRCNACSDTGFNQNGKPCKCYYIHWNLIQP